MKLIDNIPVWGDPDESSVVQIKRCALSPDIAKVALMADHHKGYAVPIGGVVAYRNAISPSGVGFDIGCGNKAVLTDAFAEDIVDNIKVIMDDIASSISFGMGLVNDVKQHDNPVFDDPLWGMIPAKNLKPLAQSQLGTVGGGNHYVDLFVDEKSRVWIGVHFGSRGFGHKTATFFLDKAGAKDGMDVDPCVISLDTELGQDYVQAMTLAGKYAYAGRDWVCSKVLQILGANALDEIHNHHNFAWKESHEGEDLWVVRKGATPAFPGQRGFVGGSMADISVILEGVESDESKIAMYSTVHGAGRAMSRTQAKGKIHRKTGERISEGLVSPAAMRERIQLSHVELRGGDVDEAPQCYKRIESVLEAHANTIKILHTLRPIGVAMAGVGVIDPYKD